MLPMQSKSSEEKIRMNVSQQDVSDDVAVPSIRGLLCVKCGVPITQEAALFSKNGKQIHTFANPAGVVFSIGCFNSVFGVSTDGTPDSAFSWFSGYAWVAVVCTTCGFHLGWQFVGTDTFYGLIVDRLIFLSGATPFGG